jgi:precorrin-6B methylase 2
MRNGMSHVPEPRAADRIMGIAFGFMAAKALLSAVELGIFTALGAGPLDGETLRRRTGLHARGARDFLDALVALHLLEREGDDLYRNASDTGLLLDRSASGYIGSLLEMANARLYPFWGNLTEALRTGAPQNEAREGDEAFRAIYADQQRLASFLGAMTALSAEPAEALVHRFPWHEHRTFADIGSAEGALPVAVARAHPNLSVIGFDLPPVAPLFERYVRAHGLADRIRFQAGDFTTGPIPSAEVLVMGHVLHDWDAAMKRMLLVKAHAALPPGGALIVYDRMIDDARRENATALLTSLNMLIETPGGFDYTGADCRRWMREAGFRRVDVEPLVGPYSFAVGRK